MPLVGTFHSHYWAGSNGAGPIPPAGAGKSGYQLWQRSVIGFCLLLSVALKGAV